MVERANTPNELLKQARLRKGWTQERLADELYALSREQPRVGARGDINAQMISRWGNGKYPPSLFYQEKLCLLFGKSAEELGFVEQPISSVKQQPGIFEKKQDHEGTILLEKWVIDSLEDGTRLRWQ